MIGTRTVLSGYAKTAGGGTVVVQLPQNLPGNWVAVLDDTTGGSGTTPPTILDYAIFLTPTTAVGSGTGTTTPYVSAISTTSGDTTGQQTFTITAGASTWVFWQIVRVSNSSVSAYPTHN